MYDYQPNSHDKKDSHQELALLLDELLLDELLFEELLLEDELELDCGLLTVTVCSLEVVLPAVSVARTVIFAVAPAGRLLRLLVLDQVPFE